jgi:DNA-binding FadR family transcriptional regulator
MAEVAVPRREALQDTIQQRIERYIIDSGSSPGNLLPPQQELARALGISVPSLREAMKSLEAIGVVEVRHGSGTYVGRFSLDPLVDGLTFRIRLEAGENMRTMTELLEIRMMLESAYVRRVAECAGSHLVADLYQIVERMEASAQRDLAFALDDRRFHEMVYAPIKNAFLTLLVRAFWDVVNIIRPELFAGPEDLGSTAAEHRAIVDAIAAHQPDTAEQAMAAHFDGIRARIALSRP